jgi:integrase
VARKRRGRGEGSIYQREDNGLWVTSASLGYDANGKRRRKYIYGATKAEVVEKLKEFDPHRTAADGVLTVGKLAASWLERVKASVDPGTVEMYEQHVRLHIAPRVGHVKLAAFTAMHVDDLRDGLLRDGVSPAMTKKQLVTVRTVLGYAVRRKLIPANVALASELPKVPRYVPQVWTPAQVAAFTEAAKVDRFEALYLVAIDSGLRQGELLALRWPDFDPKAGTLTVTKALANRSGRLYVKETKRDRSRRSVTLAFSLDALARHRERMKGEGLDVEAGPIFADTRGGYVSKGNMRRRHYLPTLKRAGLPPTKFHSLRHTCASLLLAAGVDTKIVSERLGHATPGFTANTYQHVLPGLQQQAAERLKALLAPAV